jgi:D-alanyl-D-alanine carboxypeptidase (penicillin-binding protein 5/6)
LTVTRALIVAIVAFFLLGPVTGEADSPEEPLLKNVRGAILMNLKSESVLYIQDENRKVPPASLTKIMTLYLALDAVREGKAALSDDVKVSKRAAAQYGARLHVRAGEVVSLDLLLAGVAAVSGNDAAVAVAEHVGGSTDAFVKLMNEKAAAIGLKNTTFKNPNGLPAAGQLTTARDMLTLSKSYIENHPEALRYHGILSIKHGGVVNTNKNPLLTTLEDADGLKTGWVSASGYSLIGTAKRGDIRLVSVILGGVTPKDMADESLRLIEAGFKTVASGGRIKVKEFLASADITPTSEDARSGDTPVSAPEPEADVTSDDVPESESEADVMSDDVREPESDADATSDDAAAPEPEADVMSDDVREPEPDADTTSDDVPEPEPAVEPLVDPMPELPVEPEPATEPDVDVTSDDAAEPEPDADVKSGDVAEPEPAVEPLIDPMPELPAEPESAPEPDADTTSDDAEEPGDGSEAEVRGVDEI